MRADLQSRKHSVSDSSSIRRLLSPGDSLSLHSWSSLSVILLDWRPSRCPTVWWSLRAVPVEWTRRCKTTVFVLSRAAISPAVALLEISSLVPWVKGSLQKPDERIKRGFLLVASKKGSHYKNTLVKRGKRRNLTSRPKQCPVPVNSPL